MADTNNLQKIKDKEGDLGDLYARMDTDRDLANKKPFVFEVKDSQGHALPNLQSVTLPIAAMYANTVTSIISAAMMQTVVESDTLTEKQKHYVEAFLDAVLLEADEGLSQRMRGSLLSWLSTHICIRGAIGARYVYWYDKETEAWIPDLLPVDMRYCSYDLDRQGLDWVAPLYTRSKAAIQQEYGITIAGRSEKVRDYWDRKVNEVYIADNLQQTKPNPLGYPPFVVQTAASGFMLMDEGYQKYQGESIFFLVRDILNEKNRSASIQQTLNLMSVLPPQQKEVAEIDKTSPRPEYPNAPASVIEVLRGERYSPIEGFDVKRASLQVDAELSSIIQQCTMSNVDYGNLTFPMSNIAISNVTGLRDRTLIPRLQAIALFYQGLGRMMIDQYVKAGEETNMGKAGKKRNFNPTQLDPDTIGDYSLGYKFMAKNKEQETVNLAEAQVAREFYSELDVHKNILETEDPAGAVSRLNSQRAAQADPVIMLYRLAHALVDEAEQMSGDSGNEKLIESQLVTDQAVQMLRQRQALQAPSGQATTTPRPKTEGFGTAQSEGNLVPLLMEKAGGGGQQRTQGVPNTSGGSV